MVWLGDVVAVAGILDLNLGTAECEFFSALIFFLGRFVGFRLLAQLKGSSLCE